MSRRSTQSQCCLLDAMRVSFCVGRGPYEWIWISLLGNVNGLWLERRSATFLERRKESFIFSLVWVCDERRFREAMVCGAKSFFLKLVCVASSFRFFGSLMCMNCYHDLHFDRRAVCLSVTESGENGSCV